MNRPAWIIGFAIAFLLALAIIAVAPAQGHTEERLDQWVEDWGWDVLRQEGITHQLYMQRWDMANRHPCYFRNDCPPPPPHTHPIRVLTYSAGVEQWRPLVAQYFRADDVNIALRIMRCESGGNPDALGKDKDSGLFQHLQRYWVERSSAAGWAGASIWDPEANVAVAAWLRDSPGRWGHWTCY